MKKQMAILNLGGALTKSGKERQYEYQKIEYHIDTRIEQGLLDTGFCGLGHIMNGKRKGENGKRLMHLRQRR